MRHSPFLSELHPACGFAGHGPQVSVRLLPVGHASVKLISALESAGVNQTCHTIRAEITAEIRAAIPIFRGNRCCHI
ncbi:MAG: sporulation protein YunB [Ruminococcus callidus]